jgi:hypothetical protein
LALARITGLNFTSKYILKLNYWWCINQISYPKFYISLPAIKMKCKVLSDITPFDGLQCFGGTYRFHLQDQRVSREWNQQAETSQKKELFIATALRTSNPVNLNTVWCNTNFGSLIYCTWKKKCFNSLKFNMFYSDFGIPLNHLL